jgi:NDP-sugar pyrophosphorylase family protein
MGQVVRLRGEVFGQEVRSGDYMGVSQVGDQCLAELPEVGCLVGDWALPHLRKGGVVHTLFHSEEFEDIGTAPDYWLAHMNWLDRLGLESLIDPAARLGSEVQVRRSVVGPGCQIEGEGQVEECVILAGARVQAPLKRTVVTPSGEHMLIEPPLGTDAN